MKAGFTNSEGCSEKGPSSSQRLAPLISGPRNRINAIKAMPVTKMTRLARLICLGVRVEAANMMMIAGTSIAACRRTK